VKTLVPNNCAQIFDSAHVVYPMDEAIF